MKKYKVKLKDYEVEEMIVAKDNIMEVVSYLYGIKVPQECLVSIEEVEDK